MIAEMMIPWSIDSCCHTFDRNALENYVILECIMMTLAGLMSDSKEIDDVGAGMEIEILSTAKKDDARLVLCAKKEVRSVERILLYTQDC